MSIAEVGQVLGCKRTRVFQLLAIGTLTRAKKWGRETRVMRASVEAAIREAEPSGASLRLIPNPHRKAGRPGGEG